MPELVLNDHIRVRGRFHRSVHLGRDWDDRSSLRTYVATPTARELAHRIAAAVPDPLGSRAWSLTGPFGSGKSAFGVFLADVLARRRPIHPDAKAVRRAAKIRLAPLLPVIAVGRRTALTPILIAALAEAVRSIDPSFAARVDAGREVDAEELSRLFEEATSVVRSAGYGGLMVLIDEFGKFLEHAALHPGADDLFVLQHLAEGAARSPEQMLLVTIQHSAFADYLQGASRIQAAEWQKIQGRFTDVAFHLPAEQLLGLLGASLEPQWPAELADAYARALEIAAESDALREARRRAPIDALLPACVPFDPITSLLLWPLFRGKMAQNERSLFAFLSSHEPHGFQEFLRTTAWEGGPAPLFRVDRLYDYVTAAIGSAALLGDRARHWAEVQHALDRLPADAPALASAVVKAIALIGLYGVSIGLRATDETLAVALGDAEQVAAALSFLVRQSVVVYRRHQDDYWLWEGSDIDLEACFAQASQHVGSGGLAARLARIAQPRPWVARAHYIQTGTLRYFDVKIVDGQSSQFDHVLEHAAEQAQGDGVIIFVLAGPNLNRDSMMAAAQEATRRADAASKLRLVAFPTPVAGVEEATLELEAWQWISDHEPRLAHDQVARQEVRARVVAAQDRLSQLVGSVLGLPGHPFAPDASDWIHAGKRQPRRGPREFSRWLSELCDETYAKAPVLRNELLNRSQLSSAAAKARRNLLEAMIAHEAEPRLGLAGSPPEATMYDAVLQASGLHRLRNGRWAFGEPRESWMPIWTEIETFLDGTSDHPQPVPALVARLQQPPYGLRAGPIPVLLLAALLARRDEIAIYDEGTFVPELRIETMERLLRKPEAFSLRLFRLTPATSVVLQALHRVANTGEEPQEERAQDRLVAVVKPLVVFAARLVPYARQTRRFDDPVIVAVRHALLRAADPYALVFHELPDALGLDVIGSDAAEEFAWRLREAVLALQGAYPALLAEIEAAVCFAFSLPEHGQQAIAHLRRRAESLSGYATDRRLAAFIREALRQTSDWREGLARVVADGAPPSNWSDGDVVTFHARLQLLASDFVRLEELAAEHQQTAEATIVRVDILNGQLEQARTLLTVPPEAEPMVDALVDRMTRLREEAPSDSEQRRAWIAALARVLARELAPSTEGDEL
jgi:hypothetical protein